jgi:hypothetical protein
MSVLNIVELQNVVTNVAGTSPVGYLSNQVTQIQKMVNFEQRQINVNVLSNYDKSPIQIVSPINLSNVALTGYSGTSGATISTIATAQAQLRLGADGGLEFTQSSISTFYILSTGNATFSGSVSAQNFITLSDQRLKTEVQPITNYITILSSVNGVSFQWAATGAADVGVIAQEVAAVLPEAVTDTPAGLQVAYTKLIPVLIEAVKSLQKRVETLEGGLNNLRAEKGDV